MSVLFLIVELALALTQAVAEPIVLTRDQIAESYYDEAPADLAGAQDWLALYIGPAGSRLDRAAVRFVGEPDGDFTVYHIATEPADAVLLFSGVEALSAGPTVTLTAWPVSLEEEPVLELDLDGRGYSLRLSSTDPCRASVTLSAGGVTQALYRPGQSPFACDEPRFEVHWAGDLDRDGELDLVVSFSPKYSVHPRQLFLSSLSAPDELVAEAAVYESFAD